MPWVVIEPSPRLTKLFPGFLGSLFGIIHGLTQRGFTGMIPFGANAPERDELNASAVAVALTLFVLRDQMREKNVGRPALSPSYSLRKHSLRQRCSLKRPFRCKRSSHLQ